MQQLEITTNELVNSKGEELEENTRSNEKTRCQQQEKQQQQQQEHAQQQNAQQQEQQQHALEEEQHEQKQQQQEQEKQQEQIQQLQQQQQQQQHVESSSQYDVPRLHSSTQELSYAQEYQQLRLIPVEGSSSSENNSSSSSRSSRSSSSTLFKGPQWEDWSSNIFFLLGSILYVWLAIWDIMDDMEDEDDNDDDNDDDDDEYDNDNSFLSTLTSKYVILSLFAASCYLMDATFQIMKLVRQCDREYSDPSYYNPTPLHEHDDNDNNDDNDNDDDVPIEHEEQEEEEEDGEVPVIVVVVVDGGGTLVVDLDEHQHHHYRSFGHGQPAVTITTTTTTTTTPSSNERNHSCFGGNGGGWRRKKTYLSASVGLTFGGAAVFDLISAIWTDRDEIISEKYAIAAVDVYLVNALLLTSPILLSTISFFCQYCCKCWSSSRNVCQNQEFDLGYFGDLLFLIGSIIDVMVSYWEYESDSILYVDFGFLLSALLWLLDALLYIAADWIGFQEVCRLETENNNNNTISFAGGDRNLLENDHGPSGETSGIL